MTDLLTGNLTDYSGGISWKGKYGNLTYQDLQHMIFKTNYTTFSSPGLETEDLFTVSHEFCKKVINTNSTAKYEFMAKEKIKILIVDPNKACKLRIKEMDDSMFIFGPTDKNSGYFSYDSYELQFIVNDRSIHDGDTCLNYDKLGSSYGECVDGKFQEVFLNAYGCLPPWSEHKEILSQI